MNAEVRPIKTAAESALAASFAAAKARAAGRRQRRGPARGGLPPLRAARPAEPAGGGLEVHRLARRRCATRCRWRRRPMRPPGRASAQAGALLAELEARRIVFVDGAFVAELSDLADLEPGLAIGSMAAALAAGDPLIAAHLGKVAPSDDVAVALNTAFMGDGAVIRVAAGATLARPIHLVFGNSGLRPAAIFPRSLIVVERRRARHGGGKPRRPGGRRRPGQRGRWSLWSATRPISTTSS